MKGEQLGTDMAGGGGGDHISHLINLMDRAVAEAKERRERVLESMRRTEERRGSAQGLGGGGPPSCTPSISHSQVPSVTSLPSLMDSEWQTFNASDMLAWVRHTQDPRITPGFQSSLAKKIEPLGGVHCVPMKRLPVRELQQESKSLQRPNAKSSSLQSGKTDTFNHQKQLRQQRLDAYYQKQLELEDTLRCYNMVPTYMTPKEEEELRRRSPPPPRRPRREEAERWECRIPDRELGQIQKHIHRVERARGLRDDKYRRVTQDIPREVGGPRKTAVREKKDTSTCERVTSRERSCKQQEAWVSQQIKGHQDRMLRGRRLSGQSRAEEEARKVPSQVLPLCSLMRRRRRKRTVVEVGAKESKWVTTFPFIQPP
ncbi:uncharacterized protein LOC132536906 [Erinaceus europaeus]|uniref:Uncharacterized protein LOC132536906 n=1 Tax=Erinaceus europaeus TaxID=9365 RepID=A0ABM3X0L2_ERIEU|nr:uncharacterized protein LOC132536906 [Erinaceus europaeus]